VTNPICSKVLGYYVDVDAKIFFKMEYFIGKNYLQLRKVAMMSNIYPLILK